MHRYTPDGQLAWRYLRLDRAPSHQIKIFDDQGRLLRSMGRQGGRLPGKIDPASFWQPAGLAVDARGRLWVTEFSQSPKRVSVWEMPDNLVQSAPKLVRQFCGPCAYGGGAAMPDPAQPWRILDTSYGVVFDLDLATGAYAPVTLPWRIFDCWKEQGCRPDLPFMGKPGVVLNVEGRCFAACAGGYAHGPEANWEPYRFAATGPALIGEYRGDAFVPLAAIGNIRMWLRGRELIPRQHRRHRTRQPSQCLSVCSEMAGRRSVQVAARGVQRRWRAGLPLGPPGAALRRRPGCPAGG
jgi:hypothetical protein